MEITIDIYIYNIYYIYILYYIYTHSSYLTIDLAFYHLASNTVVSSHFGLKEASWSQSVPQSELASSKRRSMECRQLRSTTPPVRWAPDGPG